MVFNVLNVVQLGFGKTGISPYSDILPVQSIKDLQYQSNINLPTDVITSPSTSKSRFELISFILSKIIPLINLIVISIFDNFNSPSSNTSR
jgi:hypothetical protein